MKPQPSGSGGGGEGPGDLGAIEREFRRIHQKFGRLHDELSDLEWRLRDLTREGVRSLDSSPHGGALGEPGRRSSTPLIAKFLRIEWAASNSWELHIGEHPPIVTGKNSLVELLRILAEPSGIHIQANDIYVGWKSSDEIVRRLGLRNKNALGTRLNRLRDLLEREGIDRNLVQSHRTLGVRFGLHRKGVLTVHDAFETGDGV